MPNKVKKQLSLKERLQNDIIIYSQNIVNATNQINQWLGAKLQCEQVLKKLDKDK